MYMKFSPLFLSFFVFGCKDKTLTKIYIQKRVKDDISKMV